MEDILNSIPCIYFSSSAEDLIDEANETCCRYLGYTRKQLVGMKLEKLFTASTRIFLQMHLLPLLRIQKHAEEIYITLLTRSGEQLPVLVNLSLHERETIGIVRFAGVAVYKRKKFEDDILAARKTAERALADNTALLKEKQQLQEKAEGLARSVAQMNVLIQGLQQSISLTGQQLPPEKKSPSTP